MGCFPSSDEPPDYGKASEEQLWAHLGVLSAETGWRSYRDLDAGNQDAQGDQAHTTVYELNRRFERSWADIEAELRRRQYYIWLFRVRAQLEEEEQWDEKPVSRVSVLLGTERQAQNKREWHAKAGVDQTL